MGEQTLNVKAVGLWLTANPLDAPPGALSKANNAVIRRPGIVEPRRGEEPDTDLGTGHAVQVATMTAFEGNVITYASNGKIYTRTGAGTSHASTGTFLPPDNTTAMRFSEAVGGLYFTTNAGPQRMDSSTSEPVPAGTPPGLEGKAATTGSSGWLASSATTAYRFVWGSRDGDGALLLGAPSGRILLTNAAGAARDVLLTAVIPSGVVAGLHFLQVYRTVITTTGGVDPGEDMAQVAEVFPTAAQISAGSMTYTDTSSFANGPTGYFSPSAGAGLDDSHLQPPLLTDSVFFKGYMFGVVQAYRQYLPLSLLGIGAPALVDGDGIEFRESNNAWSEGFIASSAPEGTQLVGPAPYLAWAFTRATGGTAAQNIAATVASLIRVMNAKATHMMATGTSGPDDLPGKLVATKRDLVTETVHARAIVNGEAWVPGLRVYSDVGLDRVSNIVTATTAGAHHVLTGQTVYITSTDPNFATGIKTVASTPTSSTFTYAETGINATALGQTFNTTTDDVTLTQDATPGSWATSVFEQPDAWPPRFQYQVGGPNTHLYRITATEDSLLFWTSDGLYRLTGENEDDFTLRPLDPTVNLVGQSTPVSLGNRALALTTQGVVSVSNLGVEKISTAIDQALLPYYGSTFNNRGVTDSSAFGVAYQSENEYYLFLPDLETAGTGDPASFAYVYNTQTRAWAFQQWQWAGINAPGYDVAAGVVNPVDNYLYLGSRTWLMRERKDRSLSDYQDTTGAGIPFDVAYQVQTANNPGALKQWGEVAYLLEKPQPASAALYFTTELDGTEEGGTITSEGNAAIRTYLPLNKSRSARLTCGLRHSTPSEKPSLLGLSVVYNTSSTRVGR